jgi:magnesium chelatase family protein
VAARVLEARRKALDRQACLNRSIEPADLDRFAPLEPAARARLRHEMERGRLSGRGYHRVRRVARTIADLRDGCSEAISEADAALALELRASLSRAQQGRAA